MASSSKRSLPFELVEEILYKTSLKSLLRFKSTCKQWYALLNDKRFIYKHLDLSHQQFMAIGSLPPTIQIFNPVNQALFNLHAKIPSYIDTVIHCDGLLLCLLKGRRRPFSLAVWNPLLRQVKKIPPSSSHTIFSEDFGIGYDNVSRDNYKILMRHMFDGGNTSEVEIYEFKSRLWRSVGNINTDWWTFGLGISMSGNMYWFANQYIKAKSAIEATLVANSKTEVFIQSFDFSEERFKPIYCVPFAIDYSCLGRTVVLSSFQGDKLSLLHQHPHLKTKHMKIDVWITNKVTDEVVSWSKYFNVTLSINSASIFNYTAYFINKTNDIVLWCEENVYVKFYEMGKDEIKNQVETGRRKLCSGTKYYVYVPSLIPVPE